MNAPIIRCCDFGYGILRIDVGDLSLIEHIDKTGNWKKWSVACAFSPALIHWHSRLRTFLEAKPTEVKE